MTLAWHFVGDRLRDGQPVPADGEWLEHTGHLELCVAGLHASRDPFDALEYAPGGTLCRVEVAKPMIGGRDKLVAARRRIIARRNLGPQLRAFARRCALSAVHYWNASEVVRQYLETGGERLRASASAAALECARNAEIILKSPDKRYAVWAEWHAANAAASAAGDTDWRAAKAAANAAAWAEWASAPAPKEAARLAVRATQRAEFHRLVGEAFGEIA